MLISSPFRRVLQFGKALYKGWCLYTENSRFGLQIRTKKLSELTLIKTKLYWNLIGWSKLVMLIKVGNGGMYAFKRENFGGGTLAIILAVIQLPETERRYSANSATFWQCNEKYMRDLRWQVRVIRWWYMSVMYEAICRISHIFWRTKILLRHWV